MTVSNASSKTVYAQLDEPIPAGIASNRGLVTFTSAVTPFAKSPLAGWDLRLPAHGQAVVSYQVDEPASGVSEQRLATYVQAYDAVSAQQALELIAHSGLVTRVWISPLELKLNVGQTRRLTAHGRLYNGQLAPISDLAGAVWTTAKPAVLGVDSSGRVVGLSPGTALVWLQIGGIRAHATVVVSGSGGAAQVPASPSQPPVQSSPSVSPSSTGSPTPTTTTSGSSSPGPSPTGGSPTPGTSQATAPRRRA
jgi:hypothetical protein